MSEIIKFALNLTGKLKSRILAFFGKADDAYNEYDLSLTVTDHGFGEEFEPIGKKTYNRKVKIYLGNVISAAIALFSVVSAVKIIKNIFDR